MDTSSSTITPSALPPTAPAPATPKRQFRGLNEKRLIVQESLVPGASVARIARKHGVNANQVFYWRKQYRDGLLGSEIKLLPVTVEPPTSSSEVQAGEPSPAGSPPHGSIQIKLGGAQIRIEGSPDATTLRTILEALRG